MKRAKGLKPKKQTQKTHLFGDQSDGFGFSLLAGNAAPPRVDESPFKPETTAKQPRLLGTETVGDLQKEKALREQKKRLAKAVKDQIYTNYVYVTTENGKHYYRSCKSLLPWDLSFPVSQTPNYVAAGLPKPPESNGGAGE